VRLSAADRDQRLELAGFELRHRRAAGKAGVGEHRLRQPDGVRHAQDRVGNAGRIGRAGDQVGGQDQWAARGATTACVVSLPVLVGLGLAHQGAVRIGQSLRRRRRAGWLGRVAWAGGLGGRPPRPFLLSCAAFSSRIPGARLRPAPWLPLPVARRRRQASLSGPRAGRSRLRVLIGRLGLLGRSARRYRGTSSARSVARRRCRWPSNRPAAPASAAGGTAACRRPVGWCGTRLDAPAPPPPR
jgi:hypothetical protein